MATKEDMGCNGSTLHEPDRRHVRGTSDPAQCYVRRASGAVRSPEIDGARSLRLPRGTGSVRLWLPAVFYVRACVRSSQVGECRGRSPLPGVSEVSP